MHWCMAVRAEVEQGVVFRTVLRTFPRVKLRQHILVKLRLQLYCVGQSGEGERPYYYIINSYLVRLPNRARLRSLVTGKFTGKSLFRIYCGVG